MGSPQYRLLPLQEAFLDCLTQKGQAIARQTQGALGGPGRGEATFRQPSVGLFAHRSNYLPRELGSLPDGAGRLLMDPHRTIARAS